MNRIYTYEYRNADFFDCSINKSSVRLAQRTHYNSGYYSETTKTIMYYKNRDEWYRNNYIIESCDSPETYNFVITYYKLFLPNERKL